jgi:glycine betaine/proline transport system substrate-binding protein
MRHQKSIRLTAVAAALSLAVAGCGGAKSDAGSADAPAAGSKGTVKLAINPWVGYEANAAVLGHLLEKKLGYTVDKKNLKEEISWQGFETGEVDAVVENWGHDDLKKTYITDKKVAVDLGPTGNKGVIGWYVPQWMVDKYPDITDGANLNKYANLFKTSESGDKGQLLDGDPSFVTNDAALVTNLFYFYEPQWLFAKEKYARVKLPAYTAGCDADPKKVACDYPDYVLDKVVSKKFADTNSPAFQLIKNFKWTNDDQNLVSDYITNQGMTAEAAGEKWVNEHEATWKPWIPATS